MAVFRSAEGAEDSAAKGAEQILKKIRKGDAVIGIAASGVTPFVKGALKAAREAGCSTILVTCNRGAGKGLADVVVNPYPGPEVISGSTRMKCGTATKLVLNALTSAAMVSLGKVYRNMMVDVKPQSRKLAARAERLVAEIAAVPPARARFFLRRAGYEAKTAIVMARLGVDAGQARARIKAAGGFLKKIIG